MAAWPEGWDVAGGVVVVTLRGGGGSRAAVKGRWDAECTSGRRVREVWHVAKATAGGGEESGVDQPGQ